MAKFKYFMKLLLRNLGFLLIVSELKKLWIRYRAPEHKIIKKAIIGHAKRESKPVLIWTTHKSASSLISRVFKFLRAKNLVRYFDYETQLTRYGNIPAIGDLNDVLTSQRNMLFSEPAAIYGPLRHPYRLDPLTFRHVIFLRDPRDVAVSAYYWFRDHCSVPDHKFWADFVVKRRNHLRSISLAEYSLEASQDWIIPMYAHLKNIRESGAEVMFISYDDFRCDPAQILNNVVKFAVQPINADCRGAIQEFCDVWVAPTDGTNTHRRSGASGQFRKEMTVQEVSEVTAVFEGTLSYWGFEI